MRLELAQIKLRKLFSSPEELLTSEFGFGLMTATPLQRAVSYTMCGARVPDELWSHETTQQAYGGVRPSGGEPEAIVLAAIRCAKTLEACVGVTWATQNVEMPPGLRPGEIPRVSLVSKYTDQAEAAMSYLRGAFTTSPLLSALLIEKPTTDAIRVRHPSGTPIEIMVVAGQRSGTTLISRWMAGMVFDEAPRISAEADGVVNLKDMQSAVRGRMLPKSVIIYVGSPVGATGDIYEMVQQNWENPDQKIPVVRATGPAMNPYWWTPERCAELEKRDPDAHRTDVLAQFLDPETNLFSSDDIAACSRGDEDPVDFENGHVYTACMDPATRGNAWTFAIGDTTDNRSYRIVLAKQWKGSHAAPLHTPSVLGEIAEDLERYGIASVRTDQYACDPIRDIAREKGVEVAPTAWNKENRIKAFLGLAARMRMHRLELPGIQAMREDLLGVKKRVNAGGDVQIVMTQTADGRHRDFAPMLAMLCGEYIEETDERAANLSKANDLDPIEEEIERYERELEMESEMVW